MLTVAVCAHVWAVVPSVSTEEELHKALVDPDVTSIVVTHDIVLSGIAWPLIGDVPVIARNLSISSDGPQIVAPVLDFSHLYKRVHMGANVTVVFDGLTLKGTQHASWLSMSFFSLTEGSSIVWRNLLSEQDACPPLDKLVSTYTDAPPPPSYAGSAPLLFFSPSSVSPDCIISSSSSSIASLNHYCFHLNESEGAAIVSTYLKAPVLRLN